MSKQTFLVLIIALLGCFHVGAQNFEFGLKVGINLASIDGPTEDIESYNSTAGFTGSITASYAVTDVFGFRTELQYLQMNFENEITGGSYFRVRDLNENLIFVNATRNHNLNMTKSYLYLPVSVYGKFVERFEVFGGIQVGALVNSTGAGEANLNNNVEVALNYNYGKDEAGEFSNNQTIEFNNQYAINRQIGAYYEYETKEDNFYKGIDFGVHAGVGFYFTPTLYTNLRVMYGLTDGTNDNVDRSFSEHTNNDFIYRSDADHNLTFDLTLGFKL